ncbi:hypothetical protein SC406_11295 [Legionella pneumophila serogroup 1]
MNIETVLDKKLASLQQALKSAESAFSAYMEHKTPKTAMISTEPGKESAKDSILLTDNDKFAKAVSENQSTSASNPEIQSQTNPVQNKKTPAKFI